MLMNSVKALTARERVAHAILGKAVDKVPIGELCIDDSVVRREFNAMNCEFADRLAFVQKLGLDLFCLTPVFSQLSHGLPIAGNCRWPDRHQWVTQTNVFTFAVVDGAFGWGMRSMQFDEFLTLERSSPLALQQLIATVEQANLAILADLAASGIDGIIFADDIAYQRGLFTSPATLKQYFFPALARQAQTAVRYGIPVFFHSDGNYRELIPDLIEMGFSGLHCIDSNSGMHMPELQHEFGARLCLWGHLGVNDACQAHVPESLDVLTDSIRTLAAQKRFILGTSSGLFASADIEGLKAIYLRINNKEQISI